MWIIKVALDRPYTFIVLALLILLLSPVIILTTPTDIFPNIDIPVVAIGWVYTGLSPQGLEGRLTAVYERLLRATVDNIEHIESNPVNGQVIVKVFLQPGTNLAVANAQVTATSQNILRNLPPGTLPPIILNYNASHFILFGEGSLRRALQNFCEHYHGERNHQGKANQLLFPRPHSTSIPALRKRT